MLVTIASAALITLCITLLILYCNSFSKPMLYTGIRDSAEQSKNLPPICDHTFSTLMYAILNTGFTTDNQDGMLSSKNTTVSGVLKVYTQHHQHTPPIVSYGVNNQIKHKLSYEQHLKVSMTLSACVAKRISTITHEVLKKGQDFS